MDKWISVTEMMPLRYQRVLAFGRGAIEILYIDVWGNLPGWTDGDHAGADIDENNWYSHWMPLPDLPI